MNGYGWAAISVSVIAIISLIVITLLSQKDQPDDEHKLIPSDNEYKMSNNGSGWWPQPQWGKKTVRDDNEIYASTDICPGPFTILDGWPKEEHLQESTDPSRLGDPLCVRNNNFAKDADESQWFKTNTYYKNSSGDAVSDMWQDYQDYLVKPFLRKRDMGEEINYYWEQYLNKENFYKPGTPGPDQIQSIYSDGPSTQGMHDLDKLMCPVLDYRNLSKLSPGSEQMIEYKIMNGEPSPRITPGVVGGIKYGDYYTKDDDGNYNPDVAGNQFNKCFQFSGGTPLFPDQNTNRYYLEQQCRGAGDVNNAELSEQAQQPLYSVNGDQVIPKLNDAGEYDKDSQGLCTWWSIDDPKGKDPYLPGKCLISPDFYNPMAECILPADNSEEIIFKSDDPDQSITTRDDLIGDGENITYLRNIKKGGGCNVLPKFNWIIGVCQGVSCDGWYDHNADGTSTDVLKPYKNVGSQLKLNYVAAYNFHPTKNKWIISGDSSFNTDGSKDSYDTILAHGGLDPESDTDSSKNPWLTPLPGGAALWGTGYYPIYAEGLGPGTKINEDGQVDESGVESEGMMFIISTESSYNFAWYMLNQENLNRGGVARRASHNDEEYDCLEPSNCWTDGNSGEIDFLESPFASGRAIRDTSDQVPSTPNAPTIIEQRCGDPDATEGSCPGIKGAAANDYRRLYLNNLNQFGRSFPTTVGASIGGWDGVSETNAYMVGSDPTLMDGDGKLKEQPIIYCAVVDKIGTWVYRIPQNSKDGRKLFGNYLDEDSVWSDSTNGSTKNGLSRFQAAKELDNTLNTPPDSFQSELDGHDGFTAIFIPFCQSEYGNSLQTTFCGTTKTSGFCNNWFSLLKNTGQWQYKKENHSWERPNLGWNNTDSPFTQLSNYIKGLLYGENSIYFMDERSIDDGTIINPKGSSDTDPNDPDHNYYGLGYNIDMVPFKCKKPFDEHCEDRKIGKSCALGNCNEKHSDEAGCNSDTMCQWNASDNTCNNTDWVTEYGIEPKLKHCCRNDSNPDICSNNDPCSYCNLPDSEAQKLANDDDIDPACNADGDQEKCENVKQMTPQQKCLQKRGYFSIGNDNDMKDFPWVDMNDTELKNLPCSNEPFGKEFTNVDNVKSMELVSYGFQDKQDYMINCPSKILLGSDQPWNLEDDEICAN